MATPDYDDDFAEDMVDEGEQVRHQLAATRRIGGRNGHGIGSGSGAVVSLGPLVLGPFTASTPAFDHLIHGHVTPLCLPIA